MAYVYIYGNSGPYVDIYRSSPDDQWAHGEQFEVPDELMNAYEAATAAKEAAEDAIMKLRPKQ